MTKIIKYIFLISVLIFTGCGGGGSSSSTSDNTTITEISNENIEPSNTINEGSSSNNQENTNTNESISNTENTNSNEAANDDEANENNENSTLIEENVPNVEENNEPIVIEDTNDNDVIEKGLNGEVTLTFIDDIVENLKFITDKNRIGFTDENGQFKLLEDEKQISFYLQSPYLGSRVNEVLIGEIKREELYQDKLIFIQDLFNVQREDINNENVLKVAQLIQTMNLNKSEKIRLSGGKDKVVRTRYASIDDFYENDGYFKNIKFNKKKNIEEVKKHLTNVLFKYKIFKQKLTDNPYFDEQWYINPKSRFITNGIVDVNAHINPKDYLEKYSGKGIKIAIIDSDLDIYHEDLKNRVTKNNIGADEAYHADKLHGTAVAGIIGANNNFLGIKGIASDAQIAFFKYRGLKNKKEEISHLIDEANNWGADIINASWGTENIDEVLKNKIIELSKKGRNGKGLIFVFAAGNDRKDKNNDELEELINSNDESNLKEVISVGATDENNLIASYSTPRKNLDIVAPGGSENIGIATLNFTANKENTDVLNYVLAQKEGINSPFFGTSAAAPIVSGIIALMLEKNPNLTKDEVEKILKDSADKIDSIGKYDQNGHSVDYGYGKVNLSKALELIK